MLANEIVDQTRTVSTTLGDLAENTILKATPDLQILGSQEAGSVIRTLASAVSTQIGQVASVAGVQSYEAMSEAALATLVGPEIPQTSVADHIAEAHRYDGYTLEELDAILKKDPRNSAARTARAWKFRDWKASFKPTTVDVKKVVDANLEGIVGHSMKRYTEGAFEDATTALKIGVRRMVENTYRDTIATNSERDGFATGYQRVASPKACAFCLVVALNEYTSFEQSGGYHDHCSCSTIPVYRGVKFYEPDYYAGFRSDYEAGFAAASGVTSEDVLASIRALTGRK